MDVGENTKPSLSLSYLILNNFVWFGDFAVLLVLPNLFTVDLLLAQGPKGKERMRK